MNLTMKNWLCAILITLLIQPASAQRTMSRQSSLGASARYNGNSVGAEAFYAQYTLGGFWEAGVEGEDYHCPLSTGERMRYIDMYARGGYQFRLASSRSRGIGLYAGAGIFAGAECADPFNSIPNYISLNVPQWQFLYGVYGKALLEVFIAKKVALTVDACMPVNFSSKLTPLHWSAGLGFKVLL